MSTFTLLFSSWLTLLTSWRASWASWSTSSASDWGWTRLLLLSTAGKGVSTTGTSPSVLVLGWELTVGGWLWHPVDWIWNDDLTCFGIFSRLVKWREFCHTGPILTPRWNANQSVQIGKEVRSTGSFPRHVRAIFTLVKREQLMGSTPSKANAPRRGEQSFLIRRTSLRLRWRWSSEVSKKCIHDLESWYFTW